MNWKKVVSVLLVSAMTLSMAACGDTASTSDNAAAGTETKGSTANASSDEKLVVWTLSNDLIDFGKRFQEQTGVEVDTVVIEPADYPTKVQTALLAGEKEPDIIVGEPKMLEDFFDAGFFEDLNQAPYNAQDYADQIVDYVWQVGQDDDGIQRAISYQITPAGIYYRRDIAKEVFGTDDPDEVGTLNVDQSRIDYMDLCVDLYQNDLTAYASQWSTPWYQAMAGEVPILTADIQSNADDSVNVWDADQFAEATKGLDTTTVFAFGLPSWGVLTMRDNVGETSGLWGVCSGPAAGFDGGTYIGISSQSERKDTAWEFVKFCTLNEDTANWWIEYSQGDTVSLKSALDKHKDDENQIYGGEKLYQFWLDQAQYIDTSKVTRYDKGIGDAWGNAVSSVKTGEKTKDEAISDFYDTIEATYPEITVNR